MHSVVGRRLWIVSAGRCGPFNGALSERWALRTTFDAMFLRHDVVSRHANRVWAFVPATNHICQAVIAGTTISIRGYRSTSYKNSVDEVQSNTLCRLLSERDDT